MPEQDSNPHGQYDKKEEAIESSGGSAFRRTRGSQVMYPEENLVEDSPLLAAEESLWVVAIKRLIGGILRAGGEIGKRWFLHDHSRSAAALAFYSLFSLVPLLVIVTKFAGMLVGADAAQAEISSASSMFIDLKSTEYLLGLVEKQNAPGWTGWMSLVAFGVLLFTASKVVVELREVLALIFGVRQRDGRRGQLVNHFLKRAVPLLLILSLGFAIAISAMLGAFFHFFTEQIYGGYSDLAAWKLIERIGSGLVLTLLFTLVLRLLPSAPPSLRAAAGGAIMASLLLAGLRSLMNLYFQNAGVTSIYGAAVTLVVVLIWVYFSVQIFFIGAEVAGYLQRRIVETRSERVGTNLTGQKRS